MNSEVLTTSLFVAARAIHYGSCLLAFGIVFFDQFVVGAAAAYVPVIHPSWRRVACRIVLIALLTGLVSGVAWFILVAMDMSELPLYPSLQPHILKVIATTEFGKLWQLRSMFWGLALIASVPALAARRTSLMQQVASWLALIALCALTVSLAWAGHGGCCAPAWHLAADAGHLLVCGVWPIGLLPFGLVLFQLRNKPGLEKWLGISAISRRFSALALTSVGLLIATGVLNSLPLVGSFSSLLTTNYGRVLSFKISLFALMIGMGAINLRVLTPRLAAGLGLSSEESREASLRRLRFNVSAEIVLAVLILAAVGLLGRLTPAGMACVMSQ